MSKLLAPFADMAVCDGLELWTTLSVSGIGARVVPTFAIRGEKTDVETTARTESCAAMSAPSPCKEFFRTLCVAMRACVIEYKQSSSQM